MENANGSINASELATLSLIGGYGGGYGGGGIGVGAGNHGYGYGGGGLYTGNSVLSAEAHANGTATKEAIDNNADMIRDRSSDFENAERTRQFSTLQMQGANSEGRISDRINNIELNSLRDKADNLVAINNAAKDAAQCCCDAQLKAQEVACDTQKLILSENQKTRDLINENALRSAIDTNNINATVGAINANANANTSAIVSAINANGHHGRG